MSDWTPASEPPVTADHTPKRLRTPGVLQAIHDNLCSPNERKTCTQIAEAVEQAPHPDPSKPKERTKQNGG